MLEFIRIFGIFLALAGLALAVFVFIRFKVPSAIAYFMGNENRRLKEYQKMQKEYVKGSSDRSFERVKGGDSTGTMNDLYGESSSATVVDNGGMSETATQVDSEYANALFIAQSTTTLLDNDLFPQD